MDEWLDMTTRSKLGDAVIEILQEHGELPELNGAMPR